MCFSFGTSKKGTLYNTEALKVPGPEKYNPNKPQKHKPPNWTIGTEPKNKLIQNESPGPGNYELLKYTEFGSNPQYTFGFKPQEVQIKSLTGPGSYQVQNYKKTVTKSPEYSFGVKGQIRRIVQTPGPGQYRPNPINEVKQIRFSKATREQKNNYLAPGPGSYSLSDQKSGRKFKFNCSENNFAKTFNIPRAGATEKYNFIAHINKLKKQQNQLKQSNSSPFKCNFKIITETPKKPQIQTKSPKQEQIAKYQIFLPKKGNYELPCNLVSGPKFGFGIEFRNSRQKQEQNFPVINQQQELNEVILSTKNK